MQPTEQEIHDNGVFAHSLVMAAGALLMFRGFKDVQPVVFAAGAAVTGAGAFGLYNENKREAERRNRRRLNTN